MPTTQKKLHFDFLNKAVGFLEAFSRLRNEGFFESFRVDVNSHGEGFFMVTINASGKIADAKKDHRQGIAPFFDPNSVIEKIKHLGPTKGWKINQGRCEVKTENWPKYDKAGEKVIGRYGQDIAINLVYYAQNKKLMSK